MVRERRYDVCELAIATLFQAIEADVPVVALPVVLHGNFHHRSISIWNGEGRVALRILPDAGSASAPTARPPVCGSAECSRTLTGCAPRTSPGSRLKAHTWQQHEEPANVERTDAKLVDLLTAGEVSAVVMGARSADHVPGLEPLLPDWKARQEEFHEEHGWVPINHLARCPPGTGRSKPRRRPRRLPGLQQSIDAARPEVPGGTTREMVIQYGVTDSLLATLDTAIRYAREQEIIQGDSPPRKSSPTSKTTWGNHDRKAPGHLLPRPAPPSQGGLMQYFDTHTHAISADTETYPVKPLGGTRSEWSQTRPVDVDGLIRSLDDAGVERAALVHASTVYGFDNSYAAAALARYPDRLVAVGAVDFLADSAVADLQQLIEEQGFSGVRIRVSDGTTKVPTPGSGVSDERMEGVWDYIAANDMSRCASRCTPKTPRNSSKVLAARPTHDRTP
jgi:4,5-dihydroxyphthalate decarboxylase